MNNHTDFSRLCLGHQKGERVSGRVWNPRWEGGWSPLLRAFGVVHRPIYFIAPSSSLPSLPSVDLPIAIIAIRHLLLFFLASYLFHRPLVIIAISQYCHHPSVDLPMAMYYCIISFNSFLAPYSIPFPSPPHHDCNHCRQSICQ